MAETKSVSEERAKPRPLYLWSHVTTILALTPSLRPLREEGVWSARRNGRFARVNFFNPNIPLREELLLPPHPHPTPLQVRKLKQKEIK